MGKMECVVTLYSVEKNLKNPCGHIIRYTLCVIHIIRYVSIFCMYGGQQFPLTTTLEAPFRLKVVEGC